MILNNILFALAPLITVIVMTPVIIVIAKKVDVVAYPSQDRWHSKNTPLLGGVSIFAAIVLGTYLSSIHNGINPLVMISVVLIFFSGLYDDIKGMKPYIKLLFQIIASMMVMSTGILVGKGVLFPDIITIPITMLWIIGITNALNLLDNMDGLCSGISLIISSFLGILFYLGGQNDLSIISFIVSGSTLGFLFYNFKPAKIFMGDSGSLSLGFILSIISLMGTFHTKSHVIFSLGIPLLLMSIPIFDTTLVTISRKILNRPVSQGGKDHLSHRLIALGYSERKSLILMFIISIFGGCIALGIKYLDLSLSLFFVVLILILFIGFGAMLSRVKVYGKKEYDAIISSEKREITAIRTALIYKRQIVELIVDSIIIVYSLYFSIWLQYNGTIPIQLIDILFQIIVIILPYSLLIFLIFRFYSSLWRYLTLSDTIRYMGAVTTVAISTFFISKYFFDSILHFTTLIIFFFVLFLLLMAFRGSERYIGVIIQRSIFQLLGGDIHKSSMRTLIIGAGDRGMMALKEILQNKKRDMIPIGFIDDDISKNGARIDGIKIYGNISSINNVVKTKDISKIIIAIGNIENNRLDHIKDICKNTGKIVEVFSVEFNELLNK